jgi:BolA family transcriptional regulator, general stress-responsive regulator
MKIGGMKEGERHFITLSSGNRVPICGSASHTEAQFASNRQALSARVRNRYHLVRGLAIKVFLRSPHPSMPNFILSSEEIDSLAAYIHSLSVCSGKGNIWQMDADTYRARIERKLTQAFSPLLLEITDDSHLHAGHAGHNPLGETHFSIHIVSPVFAGMSSVVRHREIYRVLSDEMRERVHALSLRALSTEEHAKKQNSIA